MLFIYWFNIGLLGLFVLHKVFSVLSPDFSLLFIDEVILYLSVILFIDLLVQEVSHILLLFTNILLSSQFFLTILFFLIDNVAHHFFIFFSDDSLLILNNGISKSTHNLFNLIFSVLLFSFSISFHFFSQSGIFLLESNIVRFFLFMNEIFISDYLN